MRAPRARIRDLEDQFVYELEAVYDMEVKLVEALGELSYQATDDSLGDRFRAHREETKEHVERVEAAFAALGRDPTRRENLVVDALLDERATYDEHVLDGDLRNVYYVGAGMQIEQLEIASYEGLLLTATEADLDDDVTDPLAENLDEEEQALENLKAVSSGSRLKSLWARLTG